MGTLPRLWEKIVCFRQNKFFQIPQARFAG